LRYFEIPISIPTSVGIKNTENTPCQKMLTKNTEMSPPPIVLRPRSEVSAKLSYRLQAEEHNIQDETFIELRTSRSLHVGNCMFKQAVHYNAYVRLE